MEKNIQNSLKVKIKDIATLSRSEVFLPIQTIEDLVTQDKDCVFAPVMYHVDSRDNFYIAKKSLLVPTVRIEPKAGWDAQYLAFWLNSSNAKTYFVQNRKAQRFQLSLTTIGNYAIFVLPNLQSVVSIEKIIAYLQANQSLDEFQKLELKHFCELRDCICYQYACEEKLYSYHSKLYQEWVQLWSSVCEGDDFDAYISKLYMELMRPESLVRSEIKRLRVIKNTL